MTAGTVVTDFAAVNGIRKITFEWTTSTDTGLVSSAATRHRYTGSVLGVCTVPGTGDVAPDDNYDITLTDENSVDVANGQLANRATATTQWVFASLGQLVNSPITLNVTNAGNSNSGTTYVFIGSGLADVATLKEALYGTTGVVSFPNAAVPANNVSFAEVLRSVWAGLMGTAAGENGITTWPTAAAPGNAVSLAEGVRYIVESQLGALTNTGGTTTLTAILGDVANSSIATRLTNLANQTTRTTAAKAMTPVAAGNLFTISGGPVRVLSIVGQITTAIQAQANSVKLTHTPTGGAAVDLSDVLEVNNAAIRKVIALDGVKATALVLSTDIGVVIDSALHMPIILTAGTIALAATASNTGAVSWYIEYEPLVTGAAVAAA